MSIKTPKMSSQLLKLLFFVCSMTLYQRVSGDSCGGADVNLDTWNTNILPSCTSWTQRFTHSMGSPRLVVYFAPGPELVADNFCRIREGTIDGRLAGTLVGGGSSVPVIVEHPSVSIFCITNLTTFFVGIEIQPVTQCGEDATGPVYNLKSPNFPSNYSVYTACVWRFQLESSTSLVFQFSTFVTESGFDILYFKDDEGNVERLSGTYDGGLNHTVTATNLTLLFISDSSREAQGFNGTVNLEGGIEQSMSVCSTTDLTITVTAEEQNTLDYELGDTLYIALDRETPLSQLNDSCKVTGSVPVFVFDIGQCEAFYKNENGMVLVSFLIWRYLAPTSAVIQREVQNKLNVTCLFESDLLLSSSNVKPQVGSVEISAENTGNFDVALNLFTNEHFNESLPVEVTVPNYIFAEVKLEEISPRNDDFIVQLEECWVTRVENSSGLPNYPVVVSGCVAPPSGGEAADAKMLIRNYHANFATFKVMSFVWTNFTDAEQFIYIYCDVTICQNSTGQCPGQMSGGKKRRSVYNNGRSQRLSAGPVHISQTTKYLLMKDTRRARDEVNEAAYNTFQLGMFVLLAAVIIGAGYLIWGKIGQDPKSKQIGL